MNWMPSSIMEKVESADGLCTIQRRVYSNGETSLWWITIRKRSEDRGTRVGGVLTMFRSLHDAKVYAEAFVEGQKNRENVHGQQ